MVYTLEKAQLIKEQIRRFTTSYSQHLSGQFTNFEFWLPEIESALEALSKYNHRFNCMRDAQKLWIEEHGTVIHEYCPICMGKCELSDRVPRPVRVPSSEIKTMHRELTNTAYEFFLRCYRDRLLDEEKLREACERIGTGIDPADLKKSRPQKR